MKKSVGLLAALAVAGAAQAQDGYSIYGGLDLVEMKLNTFVQDPAPADPQPPGSLQPQRRIDNDLNMIRARVGYYLNEDFAVEVHYGVANDKLDPEEPEQSEMDQYLGFYIVPRAQPFEWLHFQFPLGYAETTIILPDGSEVTHQSESFGLNLQFNIAPFLPDPDAIYAGIGISAGFHLYHEGDEATLRGFNGGLFFGYTLEF